MSRQLPDNPNLQFLRKQAKELFRVMPGRKLADAQHQLANEYGFATWAKLKSHVESRWLVPPEAFKAAVCNSDASRVDQILTRHPELRGRINEPLPDAGFGEQPMFAAVQRSDRATIDVLLHHGADIQKRTEWWAGGFGVLDDCDPNLADFLIERGAVLDVHSAARLGRIDDLRRFITQDSTLVRARGGDGQTPLHFASNVQIAEFLLANGAAIDATDIDHESTPAQYMLRVMQARHYPKDRQDVARYLIAHGSRTDILMASALGDVDLVRSILETRPGDIRMDVSERWFPKQNPRAGGTIYIWTLGRYRTAHTVARDFGHENVFDLLMQWTPDDLKLALACELGDEAAFRTFLSRNAKVAQSLSKADLQKLPDAAQNNNTQAVRLMLEAGWAVDATGEMGATALHWAAFNGNAEMMRQILKFHPTLEQKSKEHPSTALSWAVYGSGNGWRRETGDYVETIRALLDAGADIPPDAHDLEPSDAVLEMLP